MQNIDISVVEARVREALPRATEEEVTAIVAIFEGRTLHPDNADLLRPFGRRDWEELRVERIGLLLGCVLTGSRNGWASSLIHPHYRRLIREPAARVA